MHARYVEDVRDKRRLRARWREGAGAMQEACAREAAEHGGYASNDMDADHLIDRMPGQGRMDMADEIRDAIRAPAFAGAAGRRERRAAASIPTPLDALAVTARVLAGSRSEDDVREMAEMLRAYALRHLDRQTRQRGGRRWHRLTPRPRCLASLPARRRRQRGCRTVRRLAPHQPLEPVADQGRPRRRAGHLGR